MLESSSQVDTEGAWERRRVAFRREILAAAWELSREHGLSALSLRELAARVGMRAPSLYSYFASKEAIYDAMFAQGQRELLEALSAVPRSGADRRVFHRGARAFFDFCTADPTRYQLLFQRVVPGFEPTRESYALAVQVLELLRGQLLSAGVDDPRLADLWTAMITGLTDQQISNDPGGDRWSRLLEELVDLFCNHAGIPGPTTSDPEIRPTERSEQ
jgi:AcrR family transcriptional regulator